MDVEVLEDSPVLEVLPPNRRRLRPAVIDLTGDGDEVDEAPLPPRPAQRARRVIDLTADDAEDDDEVVIVGPPPRLVPVFFPPPAAQAAAAPAPGNRGVALVAALNSLRRQVREPAFFLPRVFEKLTAPQIMELDQLRRTIPMSHRGPPPPPPPPQRMRKVKMARVERKPMADSPCPVCFEDFAGQRVKTAYCKFGCGANVHVACMDQWKNKRNREYSRGALTCVLCRAPWNGMRSEPVP
jgi:hypothetical protein